MKKYIIYLLFASISQISLGQIQCSHFNVSVSTGSDSGYVQLYHPGMYLVSPRNATVIEWEISDFQGNIVHNDTLFGNITADQSGLMLFYHNVPVTDSMKVTALLTNDVAGLTCIVEDTLFWKTTEVTPNVYIYSWDILSGNLGTSITTSVSVPDEMKINFFPSPVSDQFQIEGPKTEYSLTIFNIGGQLVHTINNLKGSEQVDVSNLPSGLYFLNVRHDKGLESIRFVKQ